MGAYISELVSDLSIVGGDKQKVGYYIGMPMSLHRSAEAVTVLQWSRCSDHIGRNHILLLGLASSMVTTILFPFLLGACPQVLCRRRLERQLLRHHWSHDRVRHTRPSPPSLTTFCNLQAFHRRRLIAIARSLAKSTLAPFLSRMLIFLAVHRGRCHCTPCLRDQARVSVSSSSYAMLAGSTSTQRRSACECSDTGVRTV